MGIKIPEYQGGVKTPGPLNIRRRPVTILPEAIGQVGKALTEAGLAFDEKYRQAVIDDQVRNANLQLKEGINKFLIDLERDPDYEKYLEKFQKFKGDLYRKISQGLTNDEAKNLFKESYDLTMSDLSYTVKDRSQELGIAHMKANFDQRIAKLIELGDREGIEQEFTNAVAKGLKFKDEAVTEMADALYDCDYNIAQMGVMQYGIEWLYSKDAPESLTLEDREEIQKWYEAKIKVIEDAIRKEREAEVEAINEDLVHRFAAISRGEGTARDFIDYVNQTTLDPTGEYSKQWWNDKAMKLIEEPESRYEITNPEIEAKVAQYVRRTDKTTEEKANYIEQYHGKGLSTPEYNQYMDEIGWPPKPKGPKEGKPPDEMTDPGLFMEFAKKALDPTVDTIEFKKEVRENMGADKEGNARLNAPDAEKLTSWKNEHSNDPIFKQALNMFTNAFDDGFINEKELAELTNDYQIKVSSGKYTAPGLIQEAENMIASMNEEYIANKLERYREPGELFKHKETVEEYIERHPPEKRPLPEIEPGSIEDFIEWKNIDVRGKEVAITHYDIGDAFSDDGGITWYIKNRGIWYIIDRKTGEVTPYKRKR